MYHAPPRGRAAAREPTDAPTEKKRQRKQPPNQVWLDAIMSKTRSTEPSPSGVPPTAMRMMADEPMDAGSGEGWAAPPRPGFVELHAAPPTATTRSSRSPSPMATAAAVEPRAVSPNPFADQLTVGGGVLAAALTSALKDLVAEQDCSFIARGLCHLCSDKEKKLVPVVNFCPDFSPTHSLCREHLRSMYRVRLVDIFAGKNQPTVSKRALRCTVCSLSCPCSKCQLRRDAEIDRYIQWLSGPSDSTRPTTSLQDSVQDEDPHMTRRTRSRQPTPPPLPPSAGRDSSMPQTSRRRPHPPSMEDIPQSAHAEEKRRLSNRPMYYGGGEDKPSSDAGDVGYDTAAAMGGMPPVALRADEKGPVRTNRFPKRAAKESVPYALDETYGPSPPPLHAHTTPSGSRGGNAEFTPDMPSPSAASVLNCPDSEKSLVDLLSSLNQRVTPAVRYFADAEETRFRDMVEHAPYRYEREPQEHDQQPGGVSAAYGNHEYETSMRRQKRKRESVSSSRGSEETSTSMGYDVDDDAPLRGSVSVRSSVSLQMDPDRVSSYRQKAPTPLATGDRKSKPLPRPQAVEKPPSPSPRGRPSGRTRASTPPPEPKVVSSRKRDPPTTVLPSASSSARKRKSETLAAPPVPTTERKTPRGTAHRGHAHKSSPANRASEIVKRKQTQRVSSDETKHSAEEDEDEEIIEGDGDDESELDTNLDYCEVCLAAGDLVCCDVCPRSFHLKCLKMTEDDLPEGDWQCAECRKPSYFESFGAAVAERSTVPTKCLQIIQCLKSHPFSKPFLQPVENVPHYTNIVKQPMDLSTIEKKLLENKYMVSGKGTVQGALGASKILHLGAFAEDVRLVWSNCKLFNDDGSGITRAADQLSAGFESLYQDVLDFVDRSNSMRREEKSPSVPVFHSKDRDSAFGAAASQMAPRSDEATSASKHSDESAESPPNASGDDQQQPQQLKSSSDGPGSSAPSVGSITAATTKAQVPSTSADETESQPPSTTQASSPITGVSGESTEANPPSSVPTARSPSPSPVTTATSTPSPTESTTTTFAEARVLTSAASSAEKQTPEVPTPETAPRTDEQVNLSISPESTVATKDGGNTNSQSDPTK